MFPKLTFSWGKKKKSSDCEQTKVTVNDLTSSISDVSVWYVAHGVRYYNNNNTEGALLLFAGGREPPDSNKVAVRLSGGTVQWKSWI